MPSTLRLICVKVWGCEIGLPVDFMRLKFPISKDDYKYVNCENVKRGTVLLYSTYNLVSKHNLRRKMQPDETLELGKPRNLRKHCS